MSEDYGRYPRVSEVILSQVHRGAGTPEDPCRIVHQVHHTDGMFVSEFDPCVDVEKMKRRIEYAEKLLRHLWQQPGIGDASKDKIDSFFDPEPLG